MSKLSANSLLTCLKITMSTVLCVLAVACGGGGGGGGGSSSGGKTANSAPVFTSENNISQLESTNVSGYRPSATDADRNSISFSIVGGADADLFFMDSPPGWNTLINRAFDYESPLDANGDNVYEFTVRASDGKGGTATQEVRITILDRNERPRFVSRNEFEIYEDFLEVGRSVEVVDDDGDTLTFRVAGGDDAEFINIDSDNGAISFKAAPDYDMPQDSNGDNIYVVSVEVDDGKGEQATGTISVRVKPERVLSFDISFPTPGLNLGGVSNTFSVTGIVHSSDETPVVLNDIEYIRVNGTDVQLNTDNPRIWSRLVSTNEKDINVTVDVKFAGKPVQTEQFSIKNTLLLPNAIDFAIGADANTLFFVDDNSDGIFQLDKLTGDLTLVSGMYKGSGVRLNFPGSMIYDNSSNKLLVSNKSPGALLSVDLNSGNRTTIWQEDETLGESLITDAIAYHPVRNTAYIADRRQDAIYAVNIATGTRVILSQTGIGAGPDLGTVGDMCLDIENSLLYAVDLISDSLISINLDTGDREVISGGMYGFGPDFARPWLVEYDKPNNRAFVYDSDQDAIFEVNLANGARSFISSISNGSGATFDSISDLEWVEAENSLYALDLTKEQVTKVDVTTGNRSTYYSVPGYGLGEGFSNPVSIAIDGNTDKLFVSNYSPAKVITLDVPTITRSPLSSADVGSGAQFVGAFSLDYDEANNQLFVIDWYQSSLFSVDASNGDRQIIASDNIGVGVDIGITDDIVYDSVHNRAYIANNRFTGREILSVDIDTGDRSNILTNTESILSLAYDEKRDQLYFTDIDSKGIYNRYLGNTISSSSYGNGPKLLSPAALALDTINDRILVADGELNAILAVSPENGDRVLLSEEGLDKEGSGIPISIARSMAFDKYKNRIYMLDSGTDIIYLIDPVTGRRGILAN